MKLALATDRALVRATWHSTRHVAVSLLAPRAEGGQARTPLDLALVLDRSGSMAGDKWPRAVAAARAAIARLRPGDRVAVVVYDDQVDTVLPSRPAGPETRQRFDAAIAAIGPRGTTDLGAGWLTGCGLIGHPSEEPRLRRCLLLTDGLANVGITDPAELAGHARELRALGVTTSTFGVGDDYHEHLLGTLADAAGGAFYDIATAAGIGPILDRELGDALEIVCTRVRLVLRWEAELQVSALGPWGVTPEPHALTIQLDDLVSEQSLDVLAAVRCPITAPGTPIRVTAELWAGPGSGALLAEGSLVWESVPGHLNDSQPRNRPVDRLVAHHYANSARRDAARLNREGHYDAASRRLSAVARRIRKYAGDDPELRDLIQTLEREAEIHHAPMCAREAKVAYAASLHAVKGRSASGERRRGG